MKKRRREKRWREKKEREGRRRKRERGEDASRNSWKGEEVTADGSVGSKSGIKVEIEAYAAPKYHWVVVGAARLQPQGLLVCGQAVG